MGTKGRAAFEKYYGDFHPAPTKSQIKQLGGSQKYCEIIGEFYSRFLNDPITKVLLDRSHADSDVSAEEHGKRLGLMFLQRFGISNEYTRLRGNLFSNLNTAHNRAKRCPMRPSGERNGQFTLTQVYLWLGYQQQALEHYGVEENIVKVLIKHYCGVMGRDRPPRGDRHVGWATSPRFRQKVHLPPWVSRGYQKIEFLIFHRVLGVSTE